MKNIQKKEVVHLGKASALTLGWGKSYSERSTRWGK